MDKLGIKYWLGSGTLLGIVRNGKIIEWDTDIDFGMRYDDREHILSNIEEFKSFGFEVITHHDYGISFVRNNISVDIFFV